MKRLIATGVAAAAFAAGCSGESYPEQALPTSPSETPTPTTSTVSIRCYPILDHYFEGDSPKAHRFNEIYKHTKPYLASIPLGDVTVVFQRDCGTQIWKTKGNELNGTFCERGQLLPLFGEPKRPDVIEAFNALSQTGLCTQHEVELVGPVDKNP